MLPTMFGYTKSIVSSEVDLMHCLRFMLNRSTAVIQVHHLFHFSLVSTDVNQILMILAMQVLQIALFVNW